MLDDLPTTIRRALEHVYERLGAPVDDATLLHAHSNVIVALPDAGLVVRVATNPDAFDAVADAVAFTRWLAARDFPCVVPDDIPDQPWTVNGRVVSVWHYVETTDIWPPTPADLGMLLRRLHAQPVPEGMLKPFEDPLASVSKAAEAAPEVLSDDGRRWLGAQIAELRHRWNRLHFTHPLGPIHGDAHINNLMRAASGKVMLGDWDHAAIGPREWDLMQPHYTHRRFGYPDGSGLAAFTDAYGWDIRDWPGLDLLIALRELSGLSPYIRTAANRESSHKELMHRLDTLQAADHNARWRTPTDAV